MGAGLLKSRLFQPDVCSSYKTARYRTRFIHWWPNLLTSLESLSQLGLLADDPDIRDGLGWFVEHQGQDGLCHLSADDVSQTPGCRAFDIPSDWKVYNMSHIEEE